MSEETNQTVSQEETLAITPEVLIQEVAKATQIKPHQVQQVIHLLNEGNTIPFIARYRKEMTGSLDEVEIHHIQQSHHQILLLAERKADVERLIGEQDKLTPELSQAIQQATTMQQVEDIYRPYKQKRRTKAMIAKEQGLEPLADWIQNPNDSGDVLEKAQEFVSDEVETAQAALVGAHEIMAETVSDRADFRAFIRKYLNYNGVITSQLKKEDADPQKVYQMYYDFTEKIQDIQPHRTLAMNRGEKEDVLTVKVQADDQPVIQYMAKRFIDPSLDPDHRDYVVKAIEDAYKRFIQPALEREIRSNATEAADAHAIEVFGYNLRNLLLQPPLKGQRIMGFDPAYRTGCKLAMIDETGAVLDKGVIYPHKPAKEDKRAQAELALVGFIKKHAIDIIAIGNGTASRESEQFVSEVIKKHQLATKFVVVNEAGASVYSASKIARDEFPDFQVEERSAVSIARRLQDPLAELIKIDPKSMGVGQYQHDVSQKALGEQLDFVINMTVNQVGVDINTASQQLLEHVSGLTATTAKNIIALRGELGRFESRQQITSVKRLGPKTYEQAVGFIRVLGGNNPLDQTNIHPESYHVAEDILKTAGLETAEIGSDHAKEALDALSVKELSQALDVGEDTLNDILNGLKNPTADIRDGQDAPILRDDVLTMDDLEVGMQLQGVVRNVVDFGAFVDIGVKQDGLIHVSKLSKKFIKHPSEAVSVGDIVEVEVISVDHESQRIGLKRLF